MIYDVIIIGSGPAAYTAAIYTSRAFLKTLLIAGPELGGQLTTTTEIENFPGFPDGIQGPELMTNMKKQAEKFGTTIVMKTVKTIRQEDRKTYTIETDDEVFEGKSVIVATGASAKKLGIPSEERFRGKGISYCATCDGFFFRGKNIAVLGGGDTAMEEAIFLTKFASRVTIIHRRDAFRASPIMLERAKANPKINFLLNTVVEEFYGESVLQGVRVRENMGDREDKGDQGKIKELSFDGCFVAIGHTPATAFLKNTIDLDVKGYVIVQGGQHHTSTSVPGIFAAGDCVDPYYRQAIVAAGMGCMAAIDAEKWLEHT